MSERELPVTIAVERSDGSIEHVRVGSAIRAGEGYRLRLAEFTIGDVPRRGESDRPMFEPPLPRSRPAAPAAASGGGGGYGGEPTNFPNYGRSKAAPIAGASMQDLEYYANGARKSLADPAKARWHDKERQLLAVIEAEIERQGGGGGGGGAPQRAAPQRSSGGGQRSPGPSGEPDFPEPPPHTDDDIPF